MILRALPSAARPLFCLSRITQLYSCCIGECVCGGGGEGGLLLPLCGACTLSCVLQLYCCARELPEVDLLLPASLPATA